MNQEYKNKIISSCIKEINKTFTKKPQYKIKFNDEYYLNHIINVLITGISWHHLQILHKFNSKTHYKSIYNKFKFWTQHNIFKNAFYNYPVDTNVNLFIIDSTSINNKYGVESVGINPEYKKHNCTKLSIITNKYKQVLSPVIVENNKIFKNKKTLKHDISTIPKHLEDLEKLSLNASYFKLLGDKGYITRQQYKLKNKNVHIITKKRSNALTTQTSYNLKTIKSNRYKIENINRNIKFLERINLRKDRNLCNFYSFIYIGCLYNNILTSKTIQD